MKDHRITLEQFEKLISSSEINETSAVTPSSSPSVIDPEPKCNICLTRTISFSVSGIEFEAKQVASFEVERMLLDRKNKLDELSDLNSDVHYSYSEIKRNFSIFNKDKKISPDEIQEYLNEYHAINHFDSIEQMFIDAHDNQSSKYYAVILVGIKHLDNKNVPPGVAAEIFFSRKEAEGSLIRKTMKLRGLRLFNPRGDNDNEVSYVEANFLRYLVIPSSTIDLEEFKFPNCTLNLLFSDYVLENDNQPDMKFFGALLVDVSEEPLGDRWTELALYLTKGGSFICHEIGHSKTNRERTKYKLKVCETFDEVKDFFGYGRLAKELYSKGNIPYAITIP